MSDSEKFKEGYKKKGKGKVKNPPKKVEEAAEEVEEVEDDGVGESWDDDVVESWDQIDVEEMPVPVKVKKEMRKEEIQDQIHLLQSRNPSGHFLLYQPKKDLKSEV